MVNTLMIELKVSEKEAWGMSEYQYTRLTIFKNLEIARQNKANEP